MAEPVYRADNACNADNSESESARARDRDSASDNPVISVLDALIDEDLFEKEKDALDKKWATRHARNMNAIEYARSTFYVLHHKVLPSAYYLYEAERDIAFDACVALTTPLGGTHADHFSKQTLGPVEITKATMITFRRYLERVRDRVALMDRMLANEFRAFAADNEAGQHIEPCRVKISYGKVECVLWTHTRADAGELQSEINRILDSSDTYADIEIAPKSLATMTDMDVITVFEGVFGSDEDRKAARAPKIEDFVKRVWRQK